MNFQRVANVPKQDLPQCPVGPKSQQLDVDECPLHVNHPPTGEEFALGCGICRNAHTFWIINVHSKLLIQKISR